MGPVCKVTGVYEERCEHCGAEPMNAQVAPQGLGFGQALVHLKNGLRMSRRGWNGKGMWLAYQAGYPLGIPINANTARATGLAEGTVCKFLPYIMMRTAGGEFMPWNASQADVLAEDWETATA